MKGDPKAILESVKVGTEIISNVLESKNIGPMLSKLASGLSKLASVLPFLSVALDIFSSFFGNQPDPVLEEIKSKLDNLSNKMDTYHMQAMQAFDRVSFEICEGEISDERSLLESFNKIYGKSKGNLANLSIEMVCGTAL